MDVSAAKQQLGELIMMGFTGPELPAETAQFIRDARIGAVILFTQNYESPAQVAELCNQIQACKKDLPLWIGIDHEGGRVQRFKPGFTRIPDAATVGAAGSPKLAFEVAEVMARELKAVGVNLNFAPVADINTNAKNPVIGKRAYGDNEEVVTKISTAIVRGHLIAGVQPCVKHFPGHGDTSVDSHFALPQVDTDLATLKDRELKPFSKAFRSHCSFVMTAHMMVPALDPDRPATLSTKILRDFLRGEMRYTRIIVSDDMEMKAIVDHFGVGEAARLAIEAGCDLLCYRSEAAAREAYASLQADLDSGKLDPALVGEAFQRLRGLKKELLMPYSPVSVADVGKIVGNPEHAAIMAKIESAAPGSEPS